MGMIHYFSRLLAPAARLSGVFLLYIAAICVNADDGRSNVSIRPANLGSGFRAGGGSPS